MDFKKKRIKVLCQCGANAWTRVGECEIVDTAAKKRFFGPAEPRYVTIGVMAESICFMCIVCRTKLDQDDFEKLREEYENEESISSNKLQLQD